MFSFPDSIIYSNYMDQCLVYEANAIHPNFAVILPASCGTACVIAGFCLVVLGLRAMLVLSVLLYIACQIVLRDFVFLLCDYKRWQ